MWFRASFHQLGQDSELAGFSPEGWNAVQVRGSGRNEMTPFNLFQYGKIPKK